MKTSIAASLNLIGLLWELFKPSLWASHSVEPVLVSNASHEYALPIAGKQSSKHHFLKNVGGCLMLLFLSLASMSCHSKTDEDTIAPQVSTSGDYAKCKANGTLSQDDGSGSILSSVEYDYNGKPTYVIILPMKVGGDPYKDLYVQFELSRFTGKYTYTLTPSVDNAGVTYVQRPTGDSFEAPRINGKGTLEITDYIPNKYIKGKFEFTTKSGSRTFEIKEGEFQVEADF